MTVVKLSKTTYQWLQRKARERAQTPDQVAEALLRQELAPQHAYIEIVEKAAGAQAILRAARQSVV